MLVLMSAAYEAPCEAVEIERVGKVQRVLESSSQELDLDLNLHAPGKDVIVRPCAASSGCNEIICLELDRGFDANEMYRHGSTSSKECRCKPGG